MFNIRRNILSDIPPVTKAILIINVIMFIIPAFLGRSLGIDIDKYLALYNYGSDAFSPYQIITHMFMHASLGHIFFNMFGLYLFGRVLENVLGSQKFFILFIISGLAAALLQLGVNHLQVNGLISGIEQFKTHPSPDSFWLLAEKYHFDTAPEVKQLAQSWLNYPDNSGYIQQAYIMCERMVHTMLNGRMIGASGAVLGVLAAFAVLFPNVQLMIIFFPVPIKAKYLVPVYALAELFFGIANFRFDNIAHFAHLGGAIAGFLLVWYWKKNLIRPMY
jgi:membrane associated rhomboid family serine protease